tara:strand:- start:241 stop:477 length:237 start_codon:yes stop_codon:yes gene_type:complete
MSRSYVILDASEAGDIVFSEVDETSSDTLRYNVAGTKTVVKFEGDTPSFLEGKTQYTHAQILTEMAKSEWTPDRDPPE